MHFSLRISCYRLVNQQPWHRQTPISIFIQTIFYTMAPVSCQVSPTKNYQNTHTHTHTHTHRIFKIWSEDSVICLVKKLELGT
jgi:hypothetical protein